MVPPSDMHRHLAGLLSSGDGADVTFRVGEAAFPAHRTVLAVRSLVFKAELYGPMREGAAATGTAIEIHDMEAVVFGALLRFMYTDAWPETRKGEADAAMAQHLLVAADRYGLERLKLICEDKLCRRIDAGSAATILELAEQHGCRGLKTACLEFLDSSTTTLHAFVDTEGFGYLSRSCPNALKELLLKLVRR